MAMRYALHMLADREEDRLLFDHQRSLAQLLGYTDGEPAWQSSSSCRTYYRWCLELGHLNEMLIQNCSTRRSCARDAGRRYPGYQ